MPAGKGNTIVDESTTAGQASVETIALVVLMREDGSALLQLRDNKPDLPHAGMWGLPGGHCELGELLAVSAQRELREETGYVCNELHELLYVKNRKICETCPPFSLAVFWARYDGKQPLQCREGQAIQFVSRQDAEGYPMPRHLLPIWDAAMAALRTSERKMVSECGSQGSFRRPTVSHA